MIMGCGLWVFDIVIWISSIFLFLSCSCAGFIPADLCSINCGSPETSIMIGNRVFVSDFRTKFLSTPQNIMVNISSSNSTTPSEYSELYKTARIFTQTSTYTFPIRTSRHWIRLHFSPFMTKNYNTSSACFTISTQNHVLLRDFSVKDSVLVKEFSVNITSSTLVITFTPSRNSFAFLNALEVISVPDPLISDDASLVHPPGRFHGLSTRVLETAARVNMGGPKISSSNDTLWRTWVTDYGFLVDPNLATNESDVQAVHYPTGGATQDTAPLTVYGTVTKMNSDRNPDSNFNVTWGFDVDPGFRYLMRLHFCDIVSTSPNSLYFNVFIDDWIVLADFDPTSLAGGVLSVVMYHDFVTPLSVKNTIRVAIGPSTLKGVYPDAILNGLEIMKVSDS